MRARAFLCALLSAIALVACKGGSGGGGASLPPEPHVPAPVPTRSGLVFAYYGDLASTVEEVKDHATHVWAWGRGEGGWQKNTLERLHQARSAGLGVVLYPEVLHGPLEPAIAELRAFLQSADAEGLLPWIDVIYTGDEPDVNDRSDAEVRTINAAVRSLLAEFPALAGVQLAVIYGVHGYPGIDTFDWVGVDSYDEREAIFTNGRYADLKRRLRGDQRVILVPGGADPWRQMPSEFERVAHTDPQVIAVVPFLWIDTPPEWGVGNGRGIRSNPTREAYRMVGKRIKDNP